MCRKLLIQSVRSPLLFSAWVVLVTGISTRAEDFEFFEKKIRPIFVEHCYKCHSAEAEKLKGGLLLDTKADLLKGGDSGPAILPSDPEKSLLIKAVRYTDKDLQMPPKNKKLSDAQIADLAAWVKQGAPDPRVGKPLANANAEKKPGYDFEAARKSWAFHAPQDPAIPKVQNKKWPRSPIDNFILAKLEEQHLKPARPADKRALIRRATFDLIGLPPTPAEIEAFLADTSPDAFAKVVDRLLASPHYGERWARHWLDVVRYTDSLDSRGVGGEQDVAEAWRYRDWVVNAFNQDLPYDQFIIQQIAGDLLPSVEIDGLNTNGIIATGMYAIGNWGNGDADKEKILTDIADDAVDVTGRAFLGLTLACARCHDHKFDPIPTADYYSLAGIFFSSHILPKLAAKGSGESLLRIPLASKADLARRKQRETRIAELEIDLEKRRDEQIGALTKATLPQTARYLVAGWEFRHIPATGGTKMPFSQFAKDQNLDEILLKRWLDFFEMGNLGLFTKPVPNLLGISGLAAWRNAKNADTPSVVANSSAMEASFLTIKLPAHRLAVHPSPNNGVAASWKSPLAGQVRIRGRVVDVDPNCGDGIDWELAKISSSQTKRLTNGSIPNGGSQDIASSPLACEVQPGDFLQLAVFPKGDYSCDTTMLELEIAETAGQKRVWDLNQDVAPDLLASNPHPDSFGNADVWYFRDLAGQQVDAPADSGIAHWFDLAKRSAPPDLAEIRDLADKVQHEVLESRTNSPVYQCFVASRGAFWTPLRNEGKAFPPEIRTRITNAKTELADLQSHPPPPIAMALGLQEGGVPESPHAGVHDVKIHVRGRYDRLGELVPRRFPRLLAGDEQKAITEGSGRLQLAKWIAGPENPLTARVMVNRIWQHHFGEGIVRTPNNYGKLGTPPTHPELLDYLALRFSASSPSDLGLRTSDFGYGWSIKALQRAIMLSATYQQSSFPDSETAKADPENKWFDRMNRQRLDAESLRDSTLAVAGSLDPAFGGPAIRDLNNNRRTLYLMTIRSDRSNYRALFDAADPNAIVEQRIVSTVAPQALFLLNHPFALAQVKSLAAWVVQLKENSDELRLQRLYERLYGRPPSSREIKLGRQALAQVRESEPDKIKAEGLAWQQYCQVLLCANEFVYVD